MSSLPRRLRWSGLVLLAGVCAGSATARTQERALVANPGTGLVAGKVIDSRGGPVPGALTTLIGPFGEEASVLRVRADEDGAFFFANLARGEYQVVATKDGFAEGAFGRRWVSGNLAQFALAGGERRTDIAVTLWKLAAVSGVVTDEAGAPFVGASVNALSRTIVAGHPRFESVRDGRTDDRGQYRVSRLPPGDYVIAVRGESRTFLIAAPETPGATRGFTYATAAYVNPSSGGSVSLVAVAAGQQLSDIDIHATPVATVHVAGTIGGADSSAEATIQLIQDDANTRDAFFGSSTQAMQIRADGTFEFDHVPTGRYTLRAVKPPPRPADPPHGPETVIQTPTGTMTSWTSLSSIPEAPEVVPAEATWWASLPVVVGTSDLRDLSLTWRTAPRVSGHFEFDGASPRPAEDQLRRSVRIEIRPADGQMSPTQIRAIPTAGDRFTVAGIVPGRYVIQGVYRAGQTTDPWVYRGVTLAGQDVSDAPFDVGSKDVADLVITFTDRDVSAVIRGLVTANGRAAEAGTQVLLFPADRQLWTDDGEQSRRFRWATTLSGGAYVFSVLPGDYFLVAITGDAGRDWQDPEILARLSATADRITLGEAEQRTLNLRARPIK